MQFMFVTGATLLSILILFGLTRLIGYRQISQLSLYDYINSVTLGSIAAQLAVSTQWEEAAQNAVAMILYGIATWGGCASLRPFPQDTQMGSGASGHSDGKGKTLSRKFFPCAAGSG